MACGLLLVQVVAGHLDHAGRSKKRSLMGRIGAWASLPLQALFDVEQQDLVELGHRLGRPVVALHQHFAGGDGPVGRRLGRQYPNDSATASAGRTPAGPRGGGQSGAGARGSGSSRASLLA
jgi:hypothetical protein